MLFMTDFWPEIVRVEGGGGLVGVIRALAGITWGILLQELHNRRMGHISHFNPCLLFFSVFERVIF